MLEGKELLEKAKLLSKKSEDEIAKGCGYVGPSGRVTSQNMFPLEAVELYWHFVDGIWVILFIILYLL